MNAELRRSFRDEIVDLDLGKRLLLVTYLGMVALLSVCGLWPAIWVYRRLNVYMTTPLEVAVLLVGCLILFNIGYLAGLLVLRMAIPKPKEGLYSRRPDGRPPFEASKYMFNILLTKLRYATPWTSVFAPSLLSIPPLSTLYRRLFGPNTTSLTLGDTARIFDPWLTDIGKRVQLGWGCLIAAHIFDNRGLLLRKVVIEDDAVIGGEALLTPGVHVGHHAVVSARSLVSPNTRIGPYELWAGNPARKIKDLEPEQYNSELEIEELSKVRDLRAPREPIVRSCKS